MGQKQAKQFRWLSLGFCVALYVVAGFVLPAPFYFIKNSLRGLAVGLLGLSCYFREKAVKSAEQRREETAFSMIILALVAGALLILTMVKGL